MDTSHSEEYGIPLISALQPNTYDAIVLTVGHILFKEMGADKIKSLGKEIHVLYDLKYIVPRDCSDLRL